MTLSNLPPVSIPPIKNKKNLIFLTGEDLLDVDIPVVKEINISFKNEFDLTWIVILRGYGWFSKREIELFCEENNIKLILLEHIGKLKNPLTILFYLRLLKTMKNIKPDIIYDSYWGMPYMHFFRGLFLSKQKFIIGIHDVVQHYKMKNMAVRSWYTGFLIKTYQNFHLFSENQLEIFNAKYPGKNTFCSPLYLKNFGQVNNADTEKSKDVTNFLFFGIIRPNKGLDIVIKAVNKLAEKYSNFHVVVAGKCDDWDQYNAQIINTGLFTLKIGNVEKADVPDLFAQSHFLLLPYRDVTQSGVLLTAYNYNIPVIASKLPWFEEYVNDTQTGFLFESENYDELAARMEAAINLNLAGYQEMKDNLHQFIAKDIDVKAIAKDYVDFFHTIK